MSVRAWWRGSVRWRRSIARRPWIQWLLIVVVALGVAGSVFDRMERLDRTRASWGASDQVWVANVDVAIGDEVAAHLVDMPGALLPDSALRPADDPNDRVARQHIGRGDVVRPTDVMGSDSGLAAAPEGWLVAPVRERPSSGARLGEHVRVALDGFVAGTDAIVVGFVDDVTLLAVPADIAAMLSSDVAPVTLLRIP